jgi:ribonuclease HI
MNTIEYYTDGACKKNPGVGGWAVCGFDPPLERNGFEKHTTNNRMELVAVIRAFDEMEKDCNYIIYTDSQYVYKGITEWRHSWKKKDWSNSKKKVIENVDLWKELDLLVESHKNVEYQWIRGHDGNIGNEKADRLANEAILQNMSILF